MRLALGELSVIRVLGRHFAASNRSDGLSLQQISRQSGLHEDEARGALRSLLRRGWLCSSEAKPPGWTLIGEGRRRGSVIGARRSLAAH
jgi:DNA-binding IclR family transcriptional regulator